MPSYAACSGRVEEEREGKRREEEEEGGEQNVGQKEGERWGGEVEAWWE